MERTVRPTVGALLKEWRTRRHVSQLDLASSAGVSARHLSFVETGRSRPSREMVLHLAEQLDVPLRDRNALLLAAGYAPSYRASDFTSEEMAPVRDTVQRVLDAHMPFPALAVDRLWNLVAANEAALGLTMGCAPELLAPPLNVLRLAVHPEGMKPRIANFGEWSAHLLERLHRQVVLTGDAEAGALYDELASYPDVRTRSVHGGEGSELAVLLRLRTDAGEESYLSTVTTFGTALDITLAELSIEAFLPV